MHSYILQISNISSNLNEYKKLLNNCLDKESMSFELQCPICCINKVNILHFVTRVRITCQQLVLYVEVL